MAAFGAPMAEIAVADFAREGGHRRHGVTPLQRARLKSRPTNKFGR
jgi:hypothetical protein